MANDTIEWTSSVPTPHTVTFGALPGGPPIPDNPLVGNKSTPAATYDGTGYWNSGVIGVNWPAGLTFSMTFSKAGSYTYYCVLHQPQGMVGTVNVAALPVPPAPPKVGDSPSADQSGGLTGLFLVLGAVVLTTLAGGAAVVVARR
jgi:plastocyanin